MKQYNAKSKVPTILLWAIVILITIGMVVAIIVGAVKAKNSEKPADNPSQSESTTENNESEKVPGTDIPEIKPGVVPGDDDQNKSEDAGDASVDILEENRGNEKENQPHVVGDPTVIPGVKEAGDETGN